MSGTTDERGERGAGAGAPSSVKAESPEEPGSARDGGSRWLPLFSAAVGIALVFVGFSVVTYMRADDRGMDETIWSRLIFVLHGIEAIAFTAVGWLFGREVHRAEARQAKQEAKDAKADAVEAKGDVRDARDETAAAREAWRRSADSAAAADVKGWRLAEAVRSQTTTQPSGARGRMDAAAVGDERAPMSRPSTRAPTDHVRALADSLFPPV